MDIFLSNNQATTSLSNLDKVTRLFIASLTYDTFKCSLKVVNGTGKHEFQLSPKVSIEGSNNIVSKSLLNKDNDFRTIKQYIGKQDVKITLEGLIVKEDKKEGFNYPYKNLLSKEFIDKSPHYPKDQVSNLLSILKSGKVLQLNYDILTTTMEVINVVVESWSFPFTTGQANQNYAINLITDDLSFEE